MASTTVELIVEMMGRKELEQNAVKYEKVTEHPSWKSYSFFSELKNNDAIHPDELIPLLSKKKTDFQK